jgi:hypothetical protein
MNRHLALAAACLLLASSAWAERVYKYRHADGRIEYSNRVLRGPELLEVLQTTHAAPAPAPRVDPKQAAAADERLRKRAAALDAAWLEVREASSALAAIEARLSAVAEPRADEARAEAGTVVLPTPPPGSNQTPALSPSDAVGGPGSPAVGGAAGPASPAVGGPQPGALPAVGGSMTGRRGGGRSAAYVERLSALEADVASARARLDAALANYHKLRY